MDPGGAAAAVLSGVESMTTPLQQLTAASGRSFPNLLAARELTATKLIERRASLAEFLHDDDVVVVLMGSWGRSEVTSGSDDDFMLLIDGDARPDIRPSKAEIETILDRAPGDQGIFGEPVSGRRMIEKIGLEEDSNSNLSRRMLFLLESSSTQPARTSTTPSASSCSTVTSTSPSRTTGHQGFLLNDMIRYWRTMCVDFAGKEHEGPDKWGLRNAKLRTARKVLFAGGLLPVFECARLTTDEMPSYLCDQLQMPPVDRIAEAFLRHHAADPGGRALGAYDDFLGLLNDPTRRERLKDVTREQAETSAVFAEAARLGKELEHGLLALLFETETLPQLVREYGIF